jgi:hypothetical protein
MRKEMYAVTLSGEEIPVVALVGYLDRTIEGPLPQMDEQLNPILLRNHESAKDLSDARYGGVVLVDLPCPFTLSPSSSSPVPAALAQAGQACRGIVSCASAYLPSSKNSAPLHYARLVSRQ